MKPVQDAFTDSVFRRMRPVLCRLPRLVGSGLGMDLCEDTHAMDCSP